MKNGTSLCETGIPGLDEILVGGLPKSRLYLLRGAPGVGKTTLAMQFLLEGARNGEQSLYITLSETKEEIRDIAASHDWDISNISIFELSALEQALAEEAQNTIFHPSEIQLNKTTDLLLRKIEEINPRRLVLDSLSELRLLSDTPLRYRRQMLALKQYFAGKEITVMFLDDHSNLEVDLHVQSIAHGVISIEALASDYGAERRRVKVNKLRGVNFVGGYHDAIIVPGGMQIFPRLIASEYPPLLEAGMLKGGNEHLDELLGGGLDYGTSCLILGPAGTGKSSLAYQYVAAAAAKGEPSLVCAFEENLRTALSRSEALGIPLGKLIEEKLVTLKQIDPGEMAPGQLVNMVRDAVETGGAKVVVIDSLNGYLQAMPEVRFLNIQLHELLTYLSHRGVITILTVAQQGVIGSTMQTPVDLTYLADTVLLLRYFEQAGEIRKAISVLKKRIGHHELTIREFFWNQKGVHVGDPLRKFEGVLTGVPQYRGDESKMMKPR